jgi:hypothetical protein
MKVLSHVQIVRTLKRMKRVHLEGPGSKRMRNDINSL